MKSSQHLEMRCHFLVQTGKWIQWFHKNLRWHTTQTSRHDIDSSIGEVPGLGVLDPLVAPPSSAWNGEAVNQTVNGISQTTKCIQESISNIYIYTYIYIYINLYIRCRLWDPRACGHVLFILWPNIKNQLFEEMPLFHWMDDDVCSCIQPVYLMCRHTLRQVFAHGFATRSGWIGWYRQGEVSAEVEEVLPSWFIAVVALLVFGVDLCCFIIPDVLCGQVALMQQVRRQHAVLGARSMPCLGCQRTRQILKRRGNVHVFVYQVQHPPGPLGISRLQRSRNGSAIQEPQGIWGSMEIHGDPLKLLATGAYFIHSGAKIE